MYISIVENRGLIKQTIMTERQIIYIVMRQFVVSLFVHREERVNFDNWDVFTVCVGTEILVEVPSGKHAYIILTPLNPAFI